MKQVTATLKLFIGMDIHKRSWKIQCHTDLFTGKSFTMPPGSDRLKKYVDKHYPVTKFQFVTKRAVAATVGIERLKVSAGRVWSLTPATSPNRSTIVLKKPIR